MLRIKHEFITVLHDNLPGGKKEKTKQNPNPKLFSVVSKELPKVSYNFCVIFLSLDEISHRGIKAYGTKTGGLVIPNKVSP